MNRHSYKGKLNPAYKDGRTLKNHYCIICHKNSIYFYSKSHKCRTCLGKERSGSLNSNWNDGITLKNYCCRDCGNPISYNTAIYGQGRCIICSNRKEHNSMFGIHRFGKDSPRWLDGRTEIKYPTIFTNNLKIEIRTRDNFTCQCCGMTEKESQIKYNEVLHVHHIDYNKENCKEENLVTTCRKCNIKANGNRDYWFAYYTYIMENKNNGKSTSKKIN